MSYVLGFENNWQVNILVPELLVQFNRLSQSQYFYSENSIRTAETLHKKVKKFHLNLCGSFLSRNF